MAIKVNGTTVINDSRQLQNVASVDATTVAAMGAAGVGGAMSLISTTAISANVTTLDVTFPPGYKEYIVEFPRIYGTTGNVYPLIVRHLDGSGNVIAANDSYATKAAAISSSKENRIYLGQYFYNGDVNTFSSRMHFFNDPRNANTVTMGWFMSTGYEEAFAYAFNAMTYSGATNGIRLLQNWAADVQISSLSHDYRIWGMK